jgi:glutamyl-tRNA reductase
MVLVDIAVPRDLDPGIAGLDGAVLYDIDDLEAVVEANRDGRRMEARRAEALVAEEVRRFVEWRHGLAAAPIIASLRSMAEAIRQGELTRHGAQLDNLAPEERERVEALTRAIVNKLLHEPTVRVRQAAESGDGLRHMESLQHLFGLEVPDRLADAAREAGAPSPAPPAGAVPPNPLPRAS